MHNLSLKTKKLDQHAIEMFISESEKKESLWNVTSESYKNRNAKNESFKRLSELLGLSASKEVRKEIILCI